MAVSPTTPQAVTDRLAEAEARSQREFESALSQDRAPKAGAENIQLMRALIAELELGRTEQVAITEVTATGTANIANTFSIVSAQWKPVYLRIHFTGNLGTASVYLDVDHASGTAYDCRLLEVKERGFKADGSGDLNVSWDADETRGPSPWSFASGDFLKVSWTNPDSGNITWGLAIGLALA